MPDIPPPLASELSASHRAVTYECGCTAAGDLVETYCPMHGMRQLPPAALRLLHAERKRADEWMAYAGSLRCQKCNHERGPIPMPKGLTEEGYSLVYTCPCDCHVDVAALRERLTRWEETLREVKLAMAWATKQVRGSTIEPMPKDTRRWLEEKLGEADAALVAIDRVLDGGAP